MEVPCVGGDQQGVIIKCQYMETTQEEAYTMIAQQVAEVKAKKVLVVADDTDIFVLLLHFCCQGDIPASTYVLMVSPIRGRAVIDINATVTCIVTSSNTC